MFKNKIEVLVLEVSELKKIFNEDPFKNIDNDKVSLYITFRIEKNNANLQIPYESQEKTYKVLKYTDKEIFSLAIPGHTTKLMTFLEKEFGKTLTTRNWNTIEKIITA